jgi:TorA maturation chaperone TorD
LELLSDEEENGIRVYQALLADLKRAVALEAEAVLARLKSEYTALMIGPAKLPAPPWESAYLTRERIIFQESTLKVRRAYQKYQFLPANYPYEADDHLALELDNPNIIANAYRLRENSALKTVWVRQ